MKELLSEGENKKIWRRREIATVVVEREVSVGISPVFNAVFRVGGIASAYAGRKARQIAGNLVAKLVARQVGLPSSASEPRYCEGEKWSGGCLLIHPELFARTDFQLFC
jgi:hypothetical protein